MSWRRDTAALALTGLLAVVLRWSSEEAGSGSQQGSMHGSIAALSLPSLIYEARVVVEGPVPSPTADAGAVVTSAVTAGDSGEVQGTAPAPPQPMELPQVVPYDVFRAALLAFGSEANIALCVGLAESRYRSDVRGAAGEAGWLQVHPVHFARYGTSAEALRDPYEAARVAAGLRLEAGSWKPWTTAGGCL